MKNRCITIVSFAAAAALCLSAVSCKSSKQVEEAFKTDWVGYTNDNTQKFDRFFTTDEFGQFSMIEGEFKKTSGYEKSCYGFVFGYTQQDYGKLPNYIRFEINADGQYGLYSWDGTNYTDLVEANDKGTAYLYDNASIVKGLNQVNKLRIEQDTTTNKYTLYINGTKVASNIYPLVKGQHGAMAFYSVGKSDQEKFPASPVNVSYRITDSTKYVAPKTKK